MLDVAESCEWLAQRAEDRLWWIGQRRRVSAQSHSSDALLRLPERRPNKEQKAMDFVLPIDKTAASQDGDTPNPTRRLFLPLVATAVGTFASVSMPAHAKQAVSGTEAGTIWWNELRTRDPVQTRSFYAGVIGWSPRIVAQDDMTRSPVAGEKAYTVYVMRDEEVAGAEEIGSDDSTARPGWLTYVQVDDVDEAVRKATTLGGKIAQQPLDVPGVGRLAEIEDPEGNRLGLASPRP
jgi:predicted enzyme related to lactoylglutathione lyase